MANNRVYVWTAITRLFHWLMAVMILFLFLTGDEDSFIKLHVALGVSVGVLVLFRIIFGYMNVKYSSFKDFHLTIKDVLDHLANIFKAKSYLGHNPLAGFLMVFILLFILASAVTGLLAYGAEEGRGIFSFLNSSWFGEMEFFEDLHEVISNSILFLLLGHLAGIIFDLIFHKGKAFYSIFHGYKSGQGNNVKLSWGNSLFGFIWFLLAIIVLIYILSVPNNMFISDTKPPINYESVHKDFYDECIACHTLYPPYLLPANSWKVMMTNLEDHFGDDASLDEDVNKSITKFLLNNSSELSTHKAAVKVLSSLKDKNTIAITKTPFWKKTHNDIDKKVFKSERVKSKANCKVCHSDIEKGKIENENVKYIVSLGMFLEKEKKNSKPN